MNLTAYLCHHTTPKVRMAEKRGISGNIVFDNTLIICYAKGETYIETEGQTDGTPVYWFISHMPVTAGQARGELRTHSRSPTRMAGTSQCLQQWKLETRPGT